MTFKNRSSFRTLKFFLEQYPTQSFGVVIALVIAGFTETLGIGALLPLVSIIIDQGTPDVDKSMIEVFVEGALASIGIKPTIEALLIIIVVTIVSKATIIFFAMKYVGYIASDISKQVRIRLMAALMNAKWSYFSSLVGGHVSNAISEQAQRAGHCYMLAGRTIASVLQVFVYVFFAFLISMHISLLAVALGAVLGYSGKIFVRMARKAGQDMTQSMDVMLARLNESLLGVKPIKAMAQSDRFMSYLEEDADKVCVAQKKQYSATLLLQILYEPSIVILLACGLYYVVVFSDTPTSTVFLLAFLFYRLMGHASLLQNHYQNMAQTESALWSMVGQSQKAESQKEDLKGGKLPTLNSEIRLDGITLSHDGKNNLFEDFSVSIKSCKITMIFGVSGIGKTTLTDAILGMHKPQSGQVYLDGTPLDEVDIIAWRNQIGYVPQETFLFHGSIAQNVTLDSEEYSQDDIEEALKAAAAWEFVIKLKDGIHTTVGERGGKLSGGQRQRIALARSLIRKPKLLILDEATTGLDSISEDAVFSSIQTIKDETTVIMISHNADLKALADEVICL